MQSKVLRSSQCLASQHRLKLRAGFETLQNPSNLAKQVTNRVQPMAASDCQALATLGATGVDHGAAATRFHADQKAMGTGAADFGGLVSAFHIGNPKSL